METPEIFVLHKQGAVSHYTALNYLVATQGGKLKYREFSVFTKAFKALRKGDLASLKKQVINLVFLIGLLFSRNKKIVLGIAPFDHKLRFLLKIILKHHFLYYHTSWTCWDGTFHPKTKKNTPAVMEAWRYFLEERVSHIFSVTETGKRELLQNYRLDPERISVVYHSLSAEFAKVEEAPRKKNSFLYVGRVVPQKGVKEALDFFAQEPRASLTIIGNGELKTTVQRYANSHANIDYKEYVGNRKELRMEFSRHQYLLLNAKRKKNWEELFGMVIIEGMSQGTVPVASNHSGPQEIISPETGFLYEEGGMEDQLIALIEDTHDRSDLSRNCIAASHDYLQEKLAERWKAVLI